MASLTDRPRAGWRWLLPRVLKHYLPRRSRTATPQRPWAPAQTIASRYQELRPAGHRTWAPLPLHPPSAQWLWKRKEQIATAPWYLADFDEGRVFGVQGWIGASSGEFVSDVFPEPVLGDWQTAAERHIHDAESVSPTPQRLAGLTASLAMPNHTNYFHWLWQGLPRFALYASRHREIDHWIVPPSDRPYIVETLAALGIPKERMIAAKPRTYVCERLVVASQPMVASYDDAPAFPGKYLRDLVPAHPSAQLAEGSPSRPKRFLVVRGAVKARQLLNESEVAEQLKPLGFVSLSMDGLSVAQQAALFHEAEAIVGVHGAALANLVFCRPGCKVIELLPRNWPSPLYGRLATALGLDYQCLAGEEPALPWAPIQNLAADLSVAPSDLTALLRTASLSA